MKVYLILSCAMLGFWICAFGQSESPSHLNILSASAADGSASPQKRTDQKPAPATSSTTSRTPSDDVPSIDLTIKRNVDEVNVVFTVTDKHGHFVKNLRKQDFEVLDDSKPQQILSFRSETDLPLRVGLLIDTSDSIRNRFKFEQEAAIGFLNQIIRQKTDEAFVVGFVKVARVTQDYTDDTEALARGVRMLHVGGETALFDAIYYTCREKLMNPPSSSQDSRRAIILLSDGDDNQSRFTREEAVEMAQRAGVIVYAISTNLAGEKTSGDKILEHFAETTGGRLFMPSKPRDVVDAFRDIQSELRSQYAVSYHPANLEPDGRYRTIDINTKGKKNFRVRAKKGYYAPTAIAATTQDQSPATSER
jgi:Ca-activated chloride channel family protein